VLKRFVDGAAILQKQAPEQRPEWIEKSCAFRRGATAREIVVRDAAPLLWMVNLDPHPVRADDLDHPDELRRSRPWPGRELGFLLVLVDRQRPLPLPSMK
jgi:DNA primase